MPLYGYTCKQCNAEFESLVSYSRADEKQACPACGSENTARETVPKNTSFQLKGANWAKDNYGLGRPKGRRK